MNITLASFYVTGGTLRRDAPSYVARRADADLYDGLSAGYFCYVLTSRQMGKSSLMVRTAVKLRADGVSVAVLDLTAIGQNVTAEQWYEGLLGLIGQQLGLEDQLEDFWLEHRRTGPLQRWMKAIKEVVLARRQGPIVIFVDEIDAVRSLPFSTDEFFAGIREFYNRRTEDAEMARLTFCLMGVATPSDLIRDTRTTPFNIGRRIELTDFTETEAAPLALGLGRDERTSGALLKRILYWTGGHPYLTQRLCQAVAEDASVMNAGGVDRVCEQLFLSSRARERDDNLLFVRERLLRSEEADRASLLDLYLHARNHKRVPDDETNLLVSVLRLSGITRALEGYLYVRNRIYYRVFDKAWVMANMPDAEVRRQRAAYRKGLVRAAGVAAVIILIMGGLAVAAIEQRNRATRTAEKLRQTQEQLQAALLEAQRQRDLATDRGLEAEEQRQEAEEQRKEAEGKRREAEEQRTVAQEKTQQAEEQKQVAEQQRQAADEQRREAIALREEKDREAENSRRSYYDASMYLANQAWEKANLPRVQDLLKGHEPKPELGQKDLRGFEWRYRSRLAHSFLGTLTGHEDIVFSITFSPDGNRLASASSDQTVRVWDATSEKAWDMTGGREVLTIKGHETIVRSVAFSPDGKRIAGASRDRTVRVWDAASGQEVQTLKGHESDVFSVAFSPDGKRLASASQDKTVKVWDATSGQEVLTLRGHQDYVRSVAFSPDGKRLASASYDRTVRVWDAASGEELLTLKGHEGPIFSVAFSPDGKRLASASYDRTVRVWDAASGREVLALTGHEALVFSVAFSPDGKRLASASWDKTVRVWDAASGREVRTLKGHEGIVRSVAFSPDGNRLASASDDGTVKVWNTPREQEVRTLRGHRDYVKSVAFSPDGKWLASASDDRTVKVWDAASGQEVRTLKGHQDSVEAVAFSPDGKWLASAGDDRTVRIWDAISGQDLRILKGHDDIVFSVAFSPDGKRLASASGDKTVKVWDAISGQKLLTLISDYPLFRLSDLVDPANLVIKLRGGQDNFAQYLRTQFTPNTQQLLEKYGGSSPPPESLQRALIDEFNRLLKGPSLFDKQRFTQAQLTDEAKRLIAQNPQGQELVRLNRLLLEGAYPREIAKTPGVIRSVAFSPDGKRLASASDDKTVKVWDAISGQELLTFRGHEDIVASVAFSPDGKRLASASGDKTVKVWDAISGQELLTFRGHEDIVASVAFSPDGKRLASASGDKTVKVWDAISGQELLILEGHESLVKTVAFSPDGNRLASASWDGAVKLWDATSGRAQITPAGGEVLTLKGHAYPVRSVAFSPDGNRLASASNDGTVKVWDANDQETTVLSSSHRF